MVEYDRPADNSILYYTARRFFQYRNHPACELFRKNRMNASDIIKAKQCGALYKAYYHPTIFSSNTSTWSTVVSTVYPISSNTTSTPSTISCINTVFNYICEKPVISYELANNIACGKYVCGGKAPSLMTWKASSTLMGAISTFASNEEVLAPPSNNLHAVRPLICPDPVYIQGTNFQNNCDVCNNFGAGINACCHSCASGQ
jgi:hypothetical protein